MLRSPFFQISVLLGTLIVSQNRAVGQSQQVVGPLKSNPSVLPEPPPNPVLAIMEEEPGDDLVNTLMKEEPGDDEMRTLMKARCRAAFMEKKVLFVKYQNGSDSLVAADEAGNRFLRAALELTEGDAETQVMLLSQYVKSRENTLNHVEVRTKIGAGMEDELHHARYMVIDAKIQLLRAKQRLTQSGPESPGTQSSESLDAVKPTDSGCGDNLNVTCPCQPTKTRCLEAGRYVRRRLCR